MKERGSRTTFGLLEQLLDCCKIEFRALENYKSGIQTLLGALWAKVFLAFTESIIHKIRTSCPQTCVLESLSFKFADPIAL